MDTTTVINTEISVDRILALTAEKQSLQNTINSLNREIGSKETLIEKLEDDFKAFMEKQSEVRIVTQKREKDSWGCVNQTTDIEYKNLSLVKDDIRKEIDSTYKKQIESLDKEIKILKTQLDVTKEEYYLETRKLESNYRKFKQDVELEYTEKKLKLDRTLVDNNNRITSLKEELEKVKTNKTTEQLAAERLKEITDLQLYIEELKFTIKELNSMNIIQRIWNSILNGKARIIAQKQVIEKQNIVNKIRGWWY